MNKLLYFICLMCMPFGMISSQTTDNLNNSLQSSKEEPTQIEFAASKVFRSQEGTYVKLKWDQNEEKSTYTVLLKDEDGQEYAFQSTGTSITIKHLEVPKTYYWTVLGLENDVQFTKQFSTSYGDASASWELSNVLTSWKGTAKEGTDLETFLRKNGRHINAEELETFIYNFYEGVPPSLTGGNKSIDCRCTMVASDDFVLGGENYSNHNEPYSTEFCGWWWRENSYTKNRGASKDMSLSLRGRLKENQHKSYDISNYTTATTSRVHYICEGEECCGATISYGLRYETEVNAQGKYRNNGAYYSMAADMGFFSEIESNGDISLLGEPVALAVDMRESTTFNPQFWNEILDLIVPTASLALGVLALDSITASGLLNLTGGLDTLIEEVKDVIGTELIVHTSEGSSAQFAQRETQGNRFFEPNEWRLYTITTGSGLKYEDAWGKRFNCGKGYINTDGFVESGMAMAFSLTDENNNFPINCCIDEKAKWLTHSYINSGSEANLLAFCGSIIGCNAPFGGPGWTHENGFLINCTSDNPNLITASGTARREGECCEAPPLNGEFETSFTCHANFTGGDDPTDSGHEDDRGQYEYYYAGSDNINNANQDKGLDYAGGSNCVDCTEGEVAFSVPCNDGNTHSLKIVQKKGSTQQVLYSDDNVNSCNFSVMIDMEPCATYTAFHTTYNECETTTRSEVVIRTCCPLEPFPGGDTPTHGGYGNYGAISGGEIANEQKYTDGNQYIKTVTVYPNPAKNEVNISIENSNTTLAERVEIYTVQGQKVYSNLLDIGATKANIDISNLQNGIYLITIQTGTASPVTKRLVIQK